MKAKILLDKYPIVIDPIPTNLNFDVGDPVSFLDGIYKQSTELVVYNGVVTGFRLNIVTHRLEYQIVYRLKNSPDMHCSWAPINLVFESVTDAVNYYLEQMFSE